jgi:Ca-activated chloride channel family protein
MSGVRIDRVKVAAHHIIDQLGPDDIISVVSFNDFAELIVPARKAEDKAALKARVSMILTSGSTEIFKGLSLGVEQNAIHLGPRLVNHIILLTDGNTYGDQDACIKLARESVARGIGISAMGLGQDWNDKFIDELVSVTGGSSTYIRTAAEVVRFMNDHVRSFANVFAERMQIAVAPDPDIRLESAFKMMPSSQPLPVDVGWIPLGGLQMNRIISVLFQMELPPLSQPTFRTVARLAMNGDILVGGLRRYQAVSDISVEVANNPPMADPPGAILDALGKLTLYRMQERAQAALDRGEIESATQQLERLATRLLELGETELAAEARAEAHQVAFTNALSEKGRKSLKYQTRSLLLGAGAKED